MAEVPARALPPKEEVETTEEQTDVEEPQMGNGPDPERQETHKDSSPETEEVTGSKTSPEQLYAQLRQERRERKELERRLEEEKQRSSQTQNAEETQTDGETVFPDVVGEMRSIKEKLSLMERKDMMRGIVTDHPEIADKMDDFEDWLSEQENQHLPLRRAAQLFLLDHGLLGASAKPKRKGLESPTGGDKESSSPSKVTDEDLRRLRETSPRKFRKMLQEGKINVEF